MDTENKSKTPDPALLLTVVLDADKGWLHHGDAQDHAELIFRLIHRLDAYKEMLTAGLQLCALSCEFRNPALLVQAQQVLDRLYLELESRPLLSEVKEEELN